ncbi:glycosyltransferase family 25 protein [Leptolyngbya sp. KIOST-1]|uniref:glycosyltransferase family 25 protein n=1 Tax=Leptolyngbya sp. KIOST-1 TaxID=1229172 RepID=UPI0005674E9D|nr:glycosyltransferase family 25 protein [Leptolyngbya sp. KIOST-1]
MKFIDYFDRAYVLNLPERRDRREAMVKELNRVGLPLTPGKVEIFDAIKPSDPGPFERIGFRGCYLSHLEMFKQARDAGAKNLLIMEDDLQFRPDFCEYEEAVLQELSGQDWDTVQFGYFADWADPEVKISSPILKPFNGEVIGTHFHAINGKMLQPMIDFFELLLSRPVGHPDGGPMPPDGALNVIKWQYPEMNRLLAIPALGIQRSSRSDVTPSWYDHLPVLGGLANFTRNASLFSVLKSRLVATRASR